MRYARTSGVAGVELRQRRQAPPRRVAEGAVPLAVGAEREALDVEPVAVRARLTVLQEVVEGEEAAAGVVEHPVEDHAHAAPVGGVEQSAQGVVAPEHRIDREVVVGVVAMVAPRGEDRVEVDRRDAEVGEVVEPFRHAVEVAPLVAVHGGRRVPRLQPRGLRHAPAAGEAIGEDLVEDGVLDPVGRVDVGGHAAGYRRGGGAPAGRAPARGAPNPPHAGPSAPAGARPRPRRTRPKGNTESVLH